MSADRWFEEAKRLMETGDFCAGRLDWRGAYRNYGSAIEFAIKAIYLRDHQAKELPDHLKTAKSHDIEWLAKETGLWQDILKLQGQQRSRWLVVRDWDHTRRYPNVAFPAQEGKDFKAAVLDPKYGVWPWLQQIYLSN